ncbi:MAG: hypothetical protein ACI9Y1_000380 [Lentisphaeria bacterium]|jgi:hypothetical protein
MGKLIFKMVVMVVIFIGISNYMLYIMTGKLPFDIRSISMPSFSVDELMPSAPALGALSSGSDTETVYKWVDENGVTQYSNEQPPQLGEVNTEQSLKVLILDPNENIIQAVKIPAKEEVKKKVAPDLPTGNVYNPANVKKLMDDAKNVKKLLDDRAKAQEKLLNDM